ncbi:MAG: antitoxin [Patescibacteria group bacterium]
MKKSTDKHNMVFFDQEEKELYESLERGEWKSLKNMEKEIARHRTYASYTLEKMRKTESISIRLTPTDLSRIKAKAVEEGMPYQTLISSLIHKYAHKA